MGIFKSSDWNMIQYAVDRVLYPFVFLDSSDYIIVKSRSYSLNLNSKEIMLIFKLIQLECLFFLKAGAMKNIDEVNSITEYNKMNKLIQHALKFAKENTGIFRWKPSKEINELSREVRNKIEKTLLYTTENNNELIKLFHEYFIALIKS